MIFGLEFGRVRASALLNVSVTFVLSNSACSGGGGAHTAADDVGDIGESSSDDTVGTTSDVSTEETDVGLAETAETIGTSETSGTTTQAEPDIPPPVVCGPTGGGHHWILEMERIQIEARCATGYDLVDAAFTLDPVPPGAVWDAATLDWTPGLDQGAVYELTLAVPELGEVATIKIGVADRWDDPNNVPIVDPTRYTEEYGLPVLHLVTTDGLNDETYSPASIRYRGHVFTAPEIKLRGAASLGYPKNSYTLKFAKDDKFSEPAYAGGFVGKRKVTVISTFDDNSYVRQRLAYELWNRLDPDHIQVQVFSAVVFLDNQYWGLYTLADHVDGYLMEDHGLWQDGNLYKARTHDANFRATSSDGGPKQTLHDGLTKSEGMPIDGEPGAYDDLEAFVTFVATASSQEFLACIPTMIRQRDYEDWWLFVSLIEAQDSAGKNSYHYHDPIADTQWRYVPWDFNHSFGQTWQTERMGFDGDPEAYVFVNELFTRFLSEPSIGDPLRARYGTVFDHQYELDEVLSLYDQMIAEIGASALRDEGRWATEYQSYGGWSWRSDFLTHKQEVDYTRQWIIDRWTWVNSLY